MGACDMLVIDDPDMLCPDLHRRLSEMRKFGASKKRRKNWRYPSRHSGLKAVNLGD